MIFLEPNFFIFSKAKLKTSFTSQLYTISAFILSILGQYLLEFEASKKLFMNDFMELSNNIQRAMI